LLAFSPENRRPLFLKMLRRRLIPPRARPFVPWLTGALLAPIAIRPESCTARSRHGDRRAQSTIWLTRRARRIGIIAPVADPLRRQGAGQMRILIVPPIAAGLIAAATGISSPAAGTTLKEAFALCNKTGNCTVHGTPGLGANITYKGSEIFCPYGGGQCVCLLCSPQTKPADVLSQNTVGGAPDPKGPAAGGSTGAKVGAPPAAKPANQR
jgi:hypothetical protein